MEFPGNLQEMLEKAQNLQKQFKEAQGEIEKKEVEASAGGGMVSVKINGALKVLSIKIDPTIAKENDLEMLQDLVAAATNEAIRKAKDLGKNELSKLTGGISIPGFNV